MGTEPRHPTARHPHGHEEFPTLLHFAAKYGLEKLAWQLLECPGAEAACELRNLGDLTPAEIAEHAGHTKLASALKGYLQMSEFTNMYSQLKEMSKTKDKEILPEVDEDEYLLPRGANNTYSVPPPAKPYNPPTTPTSSNTNNPMTGYLEMQPVNKKNGNSVSGNGRTTPISNGRTTPVTRTNTLTRIPQPDQISNHSTKSQQSKLNNRTLTNNNETPNPDFYEDKVQAELLEIFNDFKNNVFTLPEIEQLVDNWRKRNDVQKSYKEKEDQLNRMRKEYDRIQQMLKDEMKRPTPFDRIKKLFSRKKEPQGATPTFKDLKFDSPLTGKDKTHPESLQHHNQLRPISSLSIQSTASSSSSGRMSTLSACSGMSFGDSGTHSDHEDRKHLMRQTSSDHEYFEIEEHKKSASLNCNYMIPPAPKPVLKYNSVKQPITPLQFHTINERPPHPVPRVETPTAVDQYYIQFPPSGLPVNTYLPMEHKQNSLPILEEPLNEYLVVHEPLQEYMNMPAGGVQQEHINEALPEYINFHPN